MEKLDPIENPLPGNWQTILFVVACAGAILGSTWSSAGTEADYLGGYLQYLCKPFATLMIVYWCHKERLIQNNRLTKFVFLGMSLSLLGDILLMIPLDLFIFGLLAFLSAHIAYLYAFTSDTRLFQSKAGLILYLVIGGSIYLLLWPSLNIVLKAAVGVYVIVLAGMASQLFSRWKNFSTTGSTSGALGGLLFIISDGTLAVNKFLVTVPFSAIIILSTYWAAQYLIWRSIRR